MTDILDPFPPLWSALSFFFSKKFLYTRPPSANGLWAESGQLDHQLDEQPTQLKVGLIPSRLK